MVEVYVKELENKMLMLTKVNGVLLCENKFLNNTIMKDKSMKEKLLLEAEEDI